MYQLIHTLAMGAALVALIAALWQDWGLIATLKRMFVAYLGFFILGAVMALAVRIVPLLENGPEEENQETE